MQWWCLVSKSKTRKTIETNIMGACAAKLIYLVPSNQVLHVSQQRTVGSYSVDDSDHIHEWAEGALTPSELIDPDSTVCLKSETSNQAM